MPGFGSPLFFLGIGEEPDRDGPPIGERQPAHFRGEEKASAQSSAYGYVIKHPDGTFQFLTGLDVALSVANLPDIFGAAEPQEFTPTQIRHGIIAAQSKYEPRHVNLSVPSVDTRLRRFLVTAAPVKIQAWILRFNAAAIQAGQALDYENDGLILESGILGQFAFSGGTILSELTPEVYLQSGGVPRYYSQRRCNHVFGSRACGVALADVSFATTIASLNPIQREMTITGQKADVAADYFSAGHFRHTLLGMDFAVGWSEFDGGNTKLKLTTWHPEFDAGQAITAYAGCRHTVADCRRFENAANFGGFPHVPKKNPSVNGT
jgi:hypothetical protein